MRPPSPPRPRPPKPSGSGEHARELLAQTAALFVPPLVSSALLAHTFEWTGGLALAWVGYVAAWLCTLRFRERVVPKGYLWASFWASLFGAALAWSCLPGRGLDQGAFFSGTTPGTRSMGGAAAFDVVTGGLYAFVAGAVAARLLPRLGRPFRRVAAALVAAGVVAAAALTAWGARRSASAPGAGFALARATPAIVAGPPPLYTNDAGGDWFDDRGQAHRLRRNGPYGRVFTYDVTSLDGVRLRRTYDLGSYPGFELSVCERAGEAGECALPEASAGRASGDAIVGWVDERLGVMVLESETRAARGGVSRRRIAALPLAGAAARAGGAPGSVCQGPPPFTWVASAALGVVLAALALRRWRTAERERAGLVGARPATTPGDGWAYPTTTGEAPARGAKGRGEGLGPEGAGEPYLLGPEWQGVCGPLVLLDAPAPVVSTYRGGQRAAPKAIAGKPAELESEAEAKQWVALLQAAAALALLAGPLKAWAAFALGPGP